MKHVVFVNRFFHPDSSATSIILSELIAKIHSSSSKTDAVVLTGRAKHLSILNYEVTGANNLKVIRFWQFANTNRNLIISCFNFFIFYFCTFIWLLLFTNTKSTVVAKSDPPMLSVPVSVAQVVKRFNFISWQQDVFPETAYATKILKSKILFDIILAIRDLSLRFADNIIVPSVDMKSYFVSRGISFSKLKVIENFASHNISTQPEYAEPLEKLDTCVVGYSGNLGVAHEIDLFFKLLFMLKDNKNVEFQINGSGSGFKKLKLLCFENNISNVFFNGYFDAEEINTVLNRFSFHIVTLKPDFANFVYPSKFYNGLKLKSPTIFIGPNSSSMAKLIDADGIGFVLSEDKKLRECVTYIENFRSSFTLRTEMFHNCRKSNTRSGNFDNIVAQWSELLDA